MKNIIKTLTTTAIVGSICAVCLPETVQAATLTYNLGGSNGDQASFTYAPFDINDPILTITGSEAGVPRNVRRRNDGVGVDGVDDQGTGRPGRGQIDGLEGTFEALTLNFSQRVNIISASFLRVQNNDGFTLLVDGTEVVSINDGLNNNNPYSFSSLPRENTTGSNFVFTVSENNDDYRLASVTVETEIPESTPIFSLLTVGVVGFCAYRQSNEGRS